MKRSFSKMGLIDRSALTFQSYLNGDFGKRFYTDEFLTGVCKTRSDIHASFGKAGGTLLLSTLALAYFDLLPPKVNILQNEIAVSRSFIPILNIMVSVSFFNLVIKFIDSLVIDRYISKIGQNIQIHSFNLFLIDKNPVNMWVDPLVPKYFGIKSGFGHKVALPVLGLFMTVLYIGFIGLIATLVITTSFSTYFDPSSQTSTKIISVAPVLMILLSAFIILAFSLNYKFYDADFEEYTLEPTEAFKEKLEKEMGAQPIETQQDTTA